MRRFAFLACLLLTASWAQAATILNRSVTIHLTNDGYVRTDALTVRIEQASDLDLWADYGITVPADAVLEDAGAIVTRDDGRTVRKVRRKDLKWHDSAGDVLYTSSRLAVMRMGPLQHGDVIRLHVQIRHAGPFDATSVTLAGDNFQKKLSVEVDGGSESLRWTMTGAGIPTHPLSDEHGLHLTALNIDRWEAPDDAAHWFRVAPRLLLAWGPRDSWESVGHWYDSLVADPPEVSPDVAARARAFCPQGSQPAQCLESLAAFVQRKVRYVAVEIGEGGWKPTPAADVMERAWGDCKDKAHLLQRLLRAVGISSHLVLIRSGESGRLDEAFPVPMWFNHCVLGVDASAAGLDDRPDVQDGLLIIDPTQTYGAPLWLGPECRGRPALVVDGDQSRLIHLPERPKEESVSLSLSGAVDNSGSFEGVLHLELCGGAAIPWLIRFGSDQRNQIVDRMIRVISSLVYGAQVSSVSWTRHDDGAPPSAEINARLTVHRFVRGRPGRRWFRPPSIDGLPDSSGVQKESGPVSLDPGITSFRLVCKLPSSWCPPRSGEIHVENAVGSHALRIQSDPAGGSLTVERSTTVLPSIVDPASLGDLLELIRAESRSKAARVRLRCPQE